MISLRSNISSYNSEMKTAYKRTDTINITQKRMEIIFAASLRKQSRIHNAVAVQKMETKSCVLDASGIISH